MPDMDVEQPRRFHRAIRQWMTTMVGLALGLLWLPALPVVWWLGLFLGPQANGRRNRLSVLSLAAAFYLPAPLCIVASQQGHWDPRLAWDHVAQEYLWAAPCLPGFLSAVPVAVVLHENPTHPVCQLVIGVTTLIILSLFTQLARIHIAMLIALAALAFCYSLAMSAILPAGMRM